MQGTTHSWPYFRHVADPRANPLVADCTGPVRGPQRGWGRARPVNFVVAGVGGAWWVKGVRTGNGPEAESREQSANARGLLQPPTRRFINRSPGKAVTALVCAPICPTPRNAEFPVGVSHVCYKHNKDEGRTDNRPLKAESYLGGTPTHNSVQGDRYRGGHNAVFKHHSVMRYSAAPTLAGRRGVADTGSNRDGARRQQHSRGPPPRRKQNHNYYSLMVGFCCSAVIRSTHCLRGLGNMADRDGILVCSGYRCRAGTVTCSGK